VPQSVTDSDENIGGTEQGRTTAKQPALQTLPYSIKKLACSRFEGGSFMAYDLSQIELRIAAISSGEPTMVEEYHKPEPDLHTSMAVGIWGPDVLNEPGFRSGDNTKDKRQWAKEPNFLIQYWGGAFSLYTRLSAKGVDTTLEECEEIINRVVKARPVLREWQISLLKFAEKHGYVEACPVYGTTRTMIGDVYGSLRSTVVNCPIQTRAGHTLRAIEHYLFRKFDSLHTIRSLRNRRHLLCQQVYDAVYVDTTDPEEATGLVMEATKWVEQHGYYAKLCDITGHFVPLVMEAA
jgi:DNA polymerase I-like protein with 3'-5' exonuclease and polymerase domains